MSTDHDELTLAELEAQVAEAQAEAAARTAQAPPRIEFTERGHKYLVNGEEYPSVTTVLGVVGKGGLTHWAAKETLSGVAELLLRGFPVRRGEIIRHLRRFGADISDDASQATIRPLLAERLDRMLRISNLDFESSRDAAAARGTAVHDALEGWAKKRDVPIAGNYPENVRGYIQGLAKFLLEQEPKFYASEQPVASLIHRFVGTRDMVCEVTSEKGRGLLDLKTSKRIYTSHMVQVEAYELAAVEMGEEATDWRGVVRVGRDGAYEIKESCAEPEDFLRVLAVYTSQRALEKRARAA